MNQFDPDSLLSDQYPCASFHDSSINRIEIDYQDKKAVLEMSLCVGDPHSDNSEEEANGTLTFSGLHQFIIEPPDELLSLNLCKSLWVDDYGVMDEKRISKIQYIIDQLPDDSKGTYFSISNWYSDIYVLFDVAEFEWKQ